MGPHQNTKHGNARNMISFWIFGLCNNFLFSLMLGAAQDILSNEHHIAGSLGNVTDTCAEQITTRICSTTSVGVVLICNTLPGLVVKLMAPFFIHPVPYGVRHFMVCTLQVISLLVTAFSKSVPIALVGVSISAIAVDLGEVTYLGLAGHYSKHAISTWASGTGMAGITAIIFRYYFVLVRAPTVRQVSPLRPSEWFSNSRLEMKKLSSVSINSNMKAPTLNGFRQRLKVIQVRYIY
ncbi:hypothetical protein KIN20_012801 [Parelaphostrongylus tenuis]|uniref:Battenin n=1 Tax=Parelaphostrongylus tenuis TaxID=148309 RepID=A0AAD5QM50_PARTN|nr:hypothetical protein KIN20_012801 [Parelaphostrongylus tenuis]